MIDASRNLALPYIMPSQAQKHVTHNEAIRALDCLVQLAVVTRDLDAPPAEPEDGARYIVGAGATGAWAGRAGALAAFQDGAWAFYEPKRGWLAWVGAEDRLVMHDGTGWAAIEMPVPAGGFQDVPALGVAATADAANRLTVSAEATLLDHAGSGHRLKLNKADSSATASLLFQTGYSGRAEMGTMGGDAFSIKVSGNGTGFVDALAFTAAGDATFAPGANLVLPSASLDAPFAIQAYGSDLIFKKPSSDTDLAEAGKFYFEGCGGHVDGNPFWQGFQLAAVPLREAGATRYPCMGFHWSYGSSDDPDDLAFTMAPASTGGLPVNVRLAAGHGSALTLDAERVGVGTVTPTTRLHVDGPVRVGSSLVADLPDATTVGAGTLVFVPDAGGGPALMLCDGAGWLRMATAA